MFGNLKASCAYENQSERYGGIYEVTLDDYQILNPEGIFCDSGYGIFEYDHDGNLVEQVAVVSMDFED
jgi:hypothetical protein